MGHGRRESLDGLPDPMSDFRCPPLRISCPSKKRREITIQIPLEVLGQHGLGRIERWWGGVRELDAELVEVHSHEAKRAAFVEHREKNVGPASRACFREKDLPL